jgi:hypothetical protein
VPASADRDLEIVLPCKIHRGDNVSSVGASRNHYGTLVDHPVEETPNGIIVGIPLPDDGTTHVADEGFGGHGLHDVLLFPQMIGQLVRSLPAIGSTGLIMVSASIDRLQQLLRDSLDHTVFDAANSMRTLVKPSSRDGTGAFQPGTLGYGRGKGS